MNEIKNKNKNSLVEQKEIQFMQAASELLMELQGFITQTHSSSAALALYNESGRNEYLFLLERIERRIYDSRVAERHFDQCRKRAFAHKKFPQFFACKECGECSNYSKEEGICRSCDVPALNELSRWDN